MSETGFLEDVRTSGPRGRLGVFAPWPLVGVALLLVLLIVLTPVLVSNSNQPGPGLLTQAELVVDKLSTNATVHFYVWALGETIRYDEIHIGLAGSFNWTGTSAVAWNRLNWTDWHNGSDLLSITFGSMVNPVALNISVHYVSPAGSTWYVGMIAFYVALTSPPSGESLYSSTPTSGVAVPSPVAVSNSTLPFAILLADVGPGGGP
ncbi:MAG: hypothetical protein ABSA63_05795 [Thermoplasmata archaeon]